MPPRPVSEGSDSRTGLRWFDLPDSRTGTLRRLYLWVPQAPAPTSGWPALWMLDGNAVIGTAIDAMRAQAFWPEGTNIGWGALIAVGYPIDGPFDFHQRSWDLGPPPGRNYPPFAEGEAEVRTGGGEEFSRFLLEDARDFLAGHVLLDPCRQTLFGHSLGGLLALWLMLTKSASFRSYVAASPAITWEDSFLLDHFKEFDPTSEDLSVHLSAGEWEGDELAPFQARRQDAENRLREKQQTRTLSAAAEFSAVLSDLGVSSEYETYPGETHMSVLPLAVNRAIRCAFSLT